MAVVPGSDIKFFVHFDQLRNEFLHGNHHEVQCAYLINTHRCAEKVTLQEGNFSRASKFFEIKDRTITDARKFRQYFLCPQHIKNTSRSVSPGFFFRAGWCSCREVPPNTDTTTTQGFTNPVVKKKKSQKIVTLKISSNRRAERSAADTVEDPPRISASETADVGPSRRYKKRRIPPDQGITVPKRQKPAKEVADAHISAVPRIPFSPTKLLTLTPGGHTDTRLMRPGRRSIDRTPSFAETYNNILDDEADHDCVGLASKTLQRCRRPIAVTNLKDQLQWTPMILSQHYLWDMMHFLLCEKHASEKQRYTILQKWSIELGIQEDTAEIPEATLPTPLTSEAPLSPRICGEEIDLTMESDAEAVDEGAIQAVTQTARLPYMAMENLSTTEPANSTSAPPLDSTTPSETRQALGQRKSRTSPKVQRRGRPCLPCPVPQLPADLERETIRWETEVAPEDSAARSVENGQTNLLPSAAENHTEQQSEDDVPASTMEAAGINVNLDNPDIPTLSVNDAVSDFFPSSMPWEAYQAVKDEMLKPIDQEGFVYVIRSRSRPGLVKVGKAVDIHERMKEIQKTCKLDDLELVPDPRQTKIYHATKLERLVHKELKVVQKADFKCNNRDHASKMVGHREWFEIDGSEAVNVVQRWRKWLKSKPYGDVRIQNLSEKWVHTIENHFPEPEEEEQDVHDHRRRNQKFDDFVNAGLGI